MIINKLNKDNRGMAQKNLFSSTQPQLQKTVSFFPSGTGSTGGGLFGKQGDDKPSSGGILGTNPAAGKICAKISN